VIRILPFFLAVVFAVTPSRAANVSEELHLLLGESTGSVTVSSSGSMHVSSLSNGAALLSAETGSLEITSSGGKLDINGLSFPLEPVRVDAGESVFSFRGHRYRGYMVVYPAEGNGLEAVNRVDMETYLKGVLPAEMPSKWPMEALKAQAVAARTYALYQMAQNDNGRFHMLSNTIDQVYTGINSFNERTGCAVDETSGLVLTYENRIIKAYYHSTSGSRTEDNEAVFPEGKLPYLKSVTCRYDGESPHYRWSYSLTFHEIAGRLAHAGFKFGKIRGISIKSFTRSGRARAIAVKTGSGREIIKATEFRKALGPVKIKSTWFRLRRSGDTVIFKGRGFGHGVGMCQWGAYGMAKKKFDFRKILAHYYPGAKLKTVSSLMGD
jgi:stage II sporulation protein D